MKRIICLIVSIAMLLCLCACAEQQSVPETDEEPVMGSNAFYNAVLYYQTDTGHTVPVMKRIPKEEGIAKAALSYLVSTYDNKIAASELGLVTTIPEGVTFELSIDDDKCATLNIKNLPNLESPEQERAMITCIVNTLTEFPTIDTVKIQIDGKEIGTLGNGTDISGKLNTFRLNTVDTDVATTAGDEQFTYTVYMPNSSCTLNIPVTYYSNEEPTFALAMNAFTRDGKGFGSWSGIFDDTEIISAVISEGHARVDLTESFLESAMHTEGVCEAVYDAIYLTASEFAEVSELELTVNGVPYIEDSFSVSAPLYPNVFE